MPRVNATSLTLQRGSYFSLRSKSVKSPHHTVETTHAGHRKVHLTYMYSTLVYISIPAGQSTVASTRTPRDIHTTPSNDKTTTRINRFYLSKMISKLINALPMSDMAN